MFIDLDGFKSINDGFGHQIGDEILKRVGATIAAAIRPGDAVARYGGDEFVVLMDAGAASAAQRIADKLDERIRSVDVPIGATSVRVGASIGVIRLHPAVDASADAAIARADRAMYEQKRMRSGARRIDAADGHRLSAPGPVHDVLASGDMPRTAVP